MAAPATTDEPAFTQLIDLAGSRLGGLPVVANDEFFAEKENLVKAGRAVFIEGKYTDRGKWMDGWESRRRRTPGHDWCIVRLGLPGTISGVEIDTSFFLGNHPPYASLEACRTGERLSFNEVDIGSIEGMGLTWTELLPKSQLRPGTRNFFAVPAVGLAEAWTHVRLNIYPDGGVARLRVYGEVKPDFSRMDASDIMDFAAVEHGGRVLACNDMFFGPKDNLIMPGRGVNMGDGWETRRKRAPGNDWVVVQLGAPAQIARLIIDTCHFKGNFPERASVEGLSLMPGAPLSAERAGGKSDWTTVLPESKLEADRVHAFGAEHLRALGPFTHMRLNIYPDGGISRFRVLGRLATALKVRAEK